MPFPAPERVIQQLWDPVAGHPDRHIYALLDGARNDGVYTTLTKSQAEYCCLYRGEFSRELAAAAPYLVKLEREAPLTLWLISKGWGDSWGVFFESAAPLHLLKRHFRKFLMVYDETAKPLYFRYYDPRVLRVCLPTCNAQQLEIVFGPVIRYCLEAADTNKFQSFSFNGRELAQGTVELVKA